jgi:hypothetical protein
MRSYRKRRRRGLRCVRIRVGLADVDALVKAGYLATGDRKSVLAVQNATESFVDVRKYPSWPIMAKLATKDAAC